MNSNFLTKRLRKSFGGGQARFVLPNVVLEIEPDFVVGARLDTSARSFRRIGLREIEPHTVEPLPNAPNIANLEDLRQALRGVVEVIGDGSGKLGLLLPDGAVRVSILTFETLPDDANEAESLVQWRMKENLSYPLEEAKLSYQILWKEPGSVGLMAVAAKSSMLAEYVSALGLKNDGPVLILPATAALLPLIPETETEAQLLVHSCSGWLTTVLAKGTRARTWRTKALGQAVPEEFVNLAASEVTRVVASGRDHLQIEVDKVWLCARPAVAPAVVAELALAISKEIHCLIPSGAVAAALSAAEQTLFESVGAPIAGLIANVA